MMFCRYKIGLCIPLVLKVTAFMGGCLHACSCGVPLSCALVRLVCLWDFDWGSLVFDTSFCIVLVWFVCIWMCSWEGSGGALR